MLQSTPVGQAAPHNNAQGNYPPPAGQAEQHRQDDQRRHRICAKDLQKDFEEASHKVYNSPQANVGAALAKIGQLLDTLAMRRALSHIWATTAQVEELSQGFNR